MMTAKQSYSLLIIIFILVPLTLQAIEKEQLCHSMEIRSLQELTKLQNCNIIVGHLEIVNIDFPPDAGTNYSTTVVEITDYLVIHRVHGLQSLQQLLPKLVLIRGMELLFERYAFVVYENRDLQELALISLLRIQQGSVRIESNPVLCFVDTINWPYLLRNTTQQRFTLKHNNSPNHCPYCAETNVLIQEPEAEYDTRFCWNLQSYQRKIVGHYKNCKNGCDPPICDKHGACCSADCLNGCLVSECTMCANLAKNDKCADECIFPFYQLDKRECVMDNVCRQRGHVPHGSECLKNCPDNYELVDNRNDKPYCSPNCTGTFFLNTEKDLDSIAECTSIKGSLIVELSKIKSQIIAEMERKLVNLKEITGYLKIIRSPQLVSLNFLQRLDTIRGDKLIDNKYALYVVDNHHLEHIWGKNQKVAILKGRVFFHLNPRLCHYKIMNLSDSLKNRPKISIQDASPNSNGERVVCTNPHLLNATAEDVSSTEARIKVDPFSSNDIDAIIGYSYHYKEAPVRNITMYDGRHGCGHDRWLMDISENQNVRHVIRNLKPYTQYAFFVKAISYTDYHNQVDGYSEIQYFTTNASKPDAVAKVYTFSLSTTEMEVHWWPPHISKGHIKNYLLTYEEMKTPKKTSMKNYAYPSQFNSTEEVCQCDLRDPNLSGPLPEDENYYNKEQITYDMALMNFAYAKGHVEKKIETEMNATQNISNQTNANETITKTGSFQSNQTNTNETNIILETALLNQTNANETSNIKMQNFLKFQAEQEKKALEQQDTGISGYLLKKPLPVCSSPNLSKELQEESNCTEQEKYAGIEVPSYKHSFTLSNLRPAVIYRISVRVCVDDVVNGCGPEKSITAETVSKPLQDFLKEFKPATSNQAVEIKKIPQN